MNRKLSITVLALAVAAGAWATPLLINYQGRLTDSVGAPITTAVDVTFTFWDAQAGGGQLGGFSDTDTVTPTGEGIYATLIGDDPSPLVPLSVFEGDSVWLNVNVNGEDLEPRKRIVSVGFAMRAATVDDLAQQFFSQWQALTDGDGDGHDRISAGGDDCNDMDPQTYPGATELCDYRDNDCDGEIDEGCDKYYYDGDQDGYGGDAQDFRYTSTPVPPYTAPVVGDCDDGDPDIHPNADEYCNGIDDDCDGATDEDPVDGTTYYYDGDEDGYGRNDMTASLCAPSPPYTATQGNDCNDGAPGVHPNLPDPCDAIDNDCDANTDEDFVATPCPNQNGACAGSMSTCDSGAEVCHYESMPNYLPEDTACDLLDNDCDGATDEDFVGEPCPKQVGICAGSVYTCVNGVEICDYGPGYEDPEVTCDGMDNNCDGEVDEGCPQCGNDMCESGEDCGNCPEDCSCDDADPCTVDVCEGGACMYYELCCEDGIDNDADGLTDCFDDDCEGCETLCDDNMDNDDDGFTDCDDSNCVRDTGCAAEDWDMDTVPNGIDNCPHDANPGQEDYDGDGIGDVCDWTPGG